MTIWPEALNVDQLFLRERLHSDRDRIALRLDDGEMTYGAVDLLTSRYARALRGAGADKGDRVLIVLPDGPDYVAALFAIFRIGAVAIMINPGLSEAALAEIVGRARATVAVVDDRYRDAFDRAGAGSESHSTVLSPGQLDDDQTDFESVLTAPDDPAIWLFSGGTTGAPKAVVQTHRSLVNTTTLYGQRSLQLNSEDVTMAIPKLYFGYATGSNLLFPFSVGASAILFEEHPTPQAIFDRIERHRPTVLVNVPSAINQMLADPSAPYRDMASLRLTTSAGEALPETLYQRWKETFGVELLDGLGTAEMWHVFVTNTVGDVRPGTLGRVVPGFEIKACDDDGFEVPPGDVGRLWVGGDSLGLGYFEDPERTEEAFRGKWFVGGDLVSIDEDGYVTHRGRADDAIKIKGKWFRPQELESVLLDHPSVKEAAVVAIEDDAGLSKPVAFVVADAGLSEQQLIDWSLERLDAYKHPRRVFFVEALPQTHLGKVDRSALKRLAG
ncbi:MAG: benzoate-CoA ligase family protein [Acidimicrobiia bacterium]|nr:benzoate-CoA ligase family protein [Acidimicrobiia bacterium]